MKITFQAICWFTINLLKSSDEKNYKLQRI